MGNLGYLIIDGNSLGHRYNNAPKLSIGETQVQAIYGFMRGLRADVARYQLYTPVVLWDGASWRELAFSDYKENRRKEAKSKSEIRQQEAKAAYTKQRPYIQKAFRFLGIPQVSAVNMEADDLAAILVDRYVAQGQKIILLTGDKDWIQLVGPNVVWRDPVNDRLVNQSNFKEFTGVERPQQFVEVKALAGDTGDGVPGVGGIGEKGAIEFLNEYGSMANFSNGILDKSIDPKKLHKKYQALAESDEKMLAFRRNLELVDLHTSVRPAPINLRVDKGEPDYEKLRAFCDILLFKSITQEFDEWIRVFPHFRDRIPAAA